MERKSKAFTLVELLVVIGIIGILSVLGYGIFRVARKAARNAARTSLVKQEIYGLLQDFENKCKAKPASIDFVSGGCNKITFTEAGTCPTAQTYDITPIQGITDCSVSQNCSCTGNSDNKLIVVYKSDPSRFGVCLEGSDSPEMVEGSCSQIQ